MDIIPALVGTWFICSTNFPMWLKGDKLDPTFTYSVADKKVSVPILLDEVKYWKKGKQKTLTGYDYQDQNNPLAFEWRGKGLLSLVRSHWRVALLDREGQWAVIWFSRTLFTPEGVDVISRQASLSSGQLAQIKAQMANDTLLNKHLPSLQNIKK